MSIEKSKITPYPLRLEPEVRKALENSAKEHGRSLNTEIAMRLKSTFLTTDEQFLEQTNLEDKSNLERLEKIVEKLMNQKK